MQGTAGLGDPEAPRGVNCSGGVLRGVVAGYWSASDLAAADTLSNTSRVWRCEPVTSLPLTAADDATPTGSPCLGGLRSSCREGHEGLLCARCTTGYFRGADGSCRPFSGGRPAGGAIVSLWLVIIAIGAAIGI